LTVEDLRQRMHVAGVSPLESWDWTWGEGCAAVNAYTQRENDRSKKQAVALYNAAAFLIHSLKVSFSGGEYKKFSEAFPGYEAEHAESGEMSDAAMYAVVRALNASFGGEEVN